MLEAETRYLPLHSELSMSPLKPFNIAGTNRPMTAPPDARQNQVPTTTFAEIYAAKDDRRPLTAEQGGRQDPHGVQSQQHQYQQYAMHNSPQSGYDRLDLQQQSNVRPSTGQTRRMAANFAPPKATISESRPQPHQKKRPVSPLTKAQEFLTEESDQDSITDDTQATLELKLLKALLASRKNKKSSRKSVPDGAIFQDNNSAVTSPYR